MIISNDSYLRFPQTNIASEQVIIFNAITYCVDICEIAYERLLKELIAFSENPKSENDNYPRIFADVWTIIGNATVFLNLVDRHFSVDLNLEIFSELNKTKKLRHSYQHIDERISEVFKSNDLPLYGSLSWKRNIPNTNRFHQFLLYSGVFTNNKRSLGGKVANPKIDVNDEIADIIFESVVKQGREFPQVLISIKDLMSDLKSIIEEFDIQINQQMNDVETAPRHNSNLFFQIEGHYKEI